MSDKKFKLFGDDTFSNKFVYGLAVAMFAAVIFIYFGAQNISEIPVRTTVIFAVILFFLAAVSYLVSLIIFRRALSAFVFCIICWTAFYFAQSLIMQPLNQYWPFEHGISVAVTAVAVFIAFIAALITRKNKNIKPAKAVYMFMGVITVILIINCGTLVQSSMKENEVRNTSLPIKMDFKPDNHTPPPPLHLIFTGFTPTA